MNKLEPLVAALLSGGLIAGIVALVGHFVTVWNSEQEARRQREIENEREQDAALQEYINNMRALVPDLLSLRDVYREKHLAGDEADLGPVENSFLNLHGDEQFEPLPPRWMSEGIEAQIKEVEEQAREALMMQRGMGKEEIEEIKEKINQIEQREYESEHKPLAKETSKHEVPLLQRLGRYRLQLRRYLELVRRNQVAEEQESASQQELPSQQEAALRVGESQTIAVLWSVAGRRKRVPITLVHRLGLIEARWPVLELTDAAFMHADLTEITLRDASLRFLNLRGANLSGADLSGSDLSYADLRGANLTNTDLSYVNLSGANLLPYDEHEPARLSLYNLKDHPIPSDSYLRYLAKLHSRLTRWVKNRLLRRKPVTFTNLTDVKLNSANLTGALLANADLRHTRGTLDRKQIEHAIGNDKTKLPDTDEFKPLPDRWTNGEGIEAQIKEVEDQVRAERNEKEWEALMTQRGMGKEEIEEIKEKINQIEQRLNE